MAERAMESADAGVPTRAGATAAEYFGAMVESYDSLITRAVPRYAEMTDRLIGYLPKDARSVLELGCGTGNLTLRLAAHFPEARITTVDAAPEMVEITRARLAGAGAEARVRSGGVSFVEGRFEELDFAPDSFDVVTSCISLHHVADKARLYRAIHAWLAPSRANGAPATFRFADQLRGATEEIHAWNWARWIEFCREPGGCTEEEIRSLLDHAAAHDHYTALHEHFDLLEGAGFPRRGMDCVWRNLIWGVVTADR